MLSYSGKGRIVILRKTKYFFAKFSIDLAIKYFRENTSKYFCEVSGEYEDLDENKVSVSFIIRRTVISHYIGAEISNCDFNIITSSLNNAASYLELFDLLQENKL